MPIPTVSCQECDYVAVGPAVKRSFTTGQSGQIFVLMNAGCRLRGVQSMVTFIHVLYLICPIVRPFVLAGVVWSPVMLWVLRECGSGRRARQQGVAARPGVSCFENTRVRRRNARAAAVQLFSLFVFFCAADVVVVFSNREAE